MSKIGAILVVYNFDIVSLHPVLKALCKQTDCVCVVDNSSTDNGNLFDTDSNIVYLPQMQNVGIASAQNAGLKYLLDNGYHYIIFCDQDSIIADGTVTALYDTYAKLVQQGYRVGAVGPRAYNKMTGHPYPHQCNKLAEVSLADGTHLTEVTYTMSSLSFQHADTFRHVGLMDSSLFIDGVDSEWCWRGKKKAGLRFFVNENIHMNHLLGLGTKSVGGKQISITPPYRMFYMYRNYIWLSTRNYTPVRWRIYNGIKYIAKAIYYPVMQTPRIEYLMNILRGVAAGFKNRTNN